MATAVPVKICLPIDVWKYMMEFMDLGTRSIFALVCKSLLAHNQKLNLQMHHYKTQIKCSNIDLNAKGKFIIVKYSYVRNIGTLGGKASIGKFVFTRTFLWYQIGSTVLYHDTGYGNYHDTTVSYGGIKLIHVYGKSKGKVRREQLVSGLKCKTMTELLEKYFTSIHNISSIKFRERSKMLFNIAESHLPQDDRYFQKNSVKFM